MKSAGQSQTVHAMTPTTKAPRKTDFFPLQDGMFPASQGKMDAQGPLRARMPHVQAGEKGGGSQQSYLVPDTHWSVEEDAKGLWSHYTQGAQGPSPHLQSGWAQYHSSPTGTGISAPRISNLIPQDTPPPDVLGARLAFLPECFLLTHLSLPRGRKGREARGPDPWGPPPSCFPCILLSSG